MILIVGIILIMTNRILIYLTYKIISKIKVLFYIKGIYQINLYNEYVILFSSVFYIKFDFVRDILALGNYYSTNFLLPFPPNRLVF